MVNSSILKGTIYGLIGFTSFTVADALSKHLSASFASFQISFMVSLVCIVLLLIFAKPLGGLRETFITPKWKLLWLRGLVLGSQGVVAVIAVGLLPLVKLYTLVFIAPFLSIFLGYVLLGDKVGWRRLLCVAFGFCGVLIALRPGIIPFEFGALMALLGGALAALSWIFVRFIGTGQTFLSYGMYPSIVIVILTAYPALNNFVIPDDPMLYVDMVMCAVSVLAGIIFLSHAFTLAPADVISPFHYTQLIFGALWGFLFFSEIPDFWTIVGGVVIVMSGLYIVHRERQKSRENKEVAHTDFEQIM